MNNIIENLKKIPKKCPLIAITGMCKNAGKTTFLNWLTSNLASQGQLALLTTGRDGEDYDLVAGHEKPKVLIKEGGLFVTHSNILERFSAEVEIIMKSDYKAGSFNIWLAKALQDIQTEILGPSTAQEQINLANKIKEFNPRYIIIDGSLDRKAITLKAEIDAIILVVSADFGSLSQIIDELKRLLLLTTINLRKQNYLTNEEEKLLLINKGKITYMKSSLLGYEKEIITLLQDEEVDHIYIPGVVTDSIWDKVKKAFINSPASLIINHPYQLQLSYQNLQEILKKKEIYTINRFEISALAVNSFSVKGRHLDVNLLKKEISKLTNIPLIDCMEAF